MTMMKLDTRLIAFDKAEPAQWWEIALYLVTAGRFGACFHAKKEVLREWSVPDHIDCRCSAVELGD